jgi:hypothetical protein
MVKTGDGKSLEFRAHPNYKHHVMEVDEKLLKGPAKELGKHLRELEINQVKAGVGELLPDMEIVRTQDSPLRLN